jgi:hypothetical protein
MKQIKLKKIIENSNPTKSKVNEANISKMYIVFMGLKKLLKDLEAEQLVMLNQYKTEKDEKKRAEILDKMKAGTKKLQSTRSNLSKVENNYINKMSYDDSYGE